MHIILREGNLFQATAPFAVLGVWQDEPLPTDVAAFIETEDFQGKSGQTALLYPRGTLPARRLLLIGLGERDKTTLDTMRRAAARAIRRAIEMRVEQVAFSLASHTTLAPVEMVQAIVEGAELGHYRYLDHKTDLSPEQRHGVHELVILVRESNATLEQAAATGQVIACGAGRARTLANMPPNLLTPARMGEIAQEIGQQHRMNVRVLGPDELQAQGFGGLLAVGMGSEQSPRFIIMEHGQAGPNTPTVCLVGKGITFDTGGISIKPADSMDNMKMDMGGAAAVLGAMQAVGELKLPLHIVALISAAENMLSGRAFRPGDVITTLSGKTIEVLNTDAEGRIVLADALYYAQRYKPTAIIDLATLTGAMMIALGPHAIGLMGNNQALAQRLIAAGQHTAERVWQLPLWDEYRDMVKSGIADIRNTGGGRAGGAITAAAFLDAFVGGYPWAHLDIAGTAWADEGSREYYSRGATGIGVRLLVQVLRAWHEA
ncbi:MAG: leucyl aminopeptidase [Chloroflexaceae bacterium]|nr:leucyl aminopeptidase [Chloroflexaceae bacterium]NJO05190.1 leucyl aminopeptidase [Chloroflexaceae bacterium]